ncbi:MAG: DNA-3-methyladenine glycosylase 2 family protein [Chloroflexi bacterium]|nr:DNA-3-methyladenine glycosylase 2 family protein [Chloroflexota bacterium]
MSRPLHTASFDLRPRPPFDFTLALRYLRTSPSAVLEEITGREYQRALVLAGAPVLLAVSVTGNVERPALQVTLRSREIGDETIAAARRLVQRLFSTCVDTRPLYGTAQDDPVFGALTRACYGLPLILIPDLFETLVWAILGQQVNVAFAAQCKRRLVESFGGQMVVGDHGYWLFPEPERLAEAQESELAAIQLSRQKTRYILTLARDVAEGHLDLQGLWKMPPHEAMSVLEGLLGVGRWTAEYVLMRGLGHPDVIPAADGGLRRIIGRAYGLGRTATEQEARALAESWAGWRSYAAFYWWFTLQQELKRPPTGLIPG